MKPTNSERSGLREERSFEKGRRFDEGEGGSGLCPADRRRAASMKSRDSRSSQTPPVPVAMSKTWGRDSTTERSAMRPPMSAGPMPRYRRCATADSRVVWAGAEAGTERAAAAKRAAAAACAGRTYARGVFMVSFRFAGQLANTFHARPPSCQPESGAPRQARFSIHGPDTSTGSLFRPRRIAPDALSRCDQLVRARAARHRRLG